MLKLKDYPTLFLFSVCFSSCLYQEIIDSTPKFRYDQQICLDELTAVGHFTNISITASSNSLNGERLKADLDVHLTDGNIRSYRQYELDSLSLIIAQIAATHLSNLDTYDWINVLYQRSDNLPVSDSARKFVYVYSTGNIQTPGGKKVKAVPASLNVK